MTLEYLLKQHGVTKENSNLDTSIAFDKMVGSFTGGTGDYVTVFEPTASALELEDKGYVVASIGQDSGEIPYTAYFAKKSYIEKNPDIIEGFTKAVYEGQKWVKDTDAAEVAKMIAAFFPDTDMDLLTQVVKRYKEIDAWNDTPVLKEEAFDRLQTVMEEAGELTRRAPYDKVVDTSFAEKVIK
jgi:NitT/TauT family transport system substrate-binding protein